MKKLKKQMLQDDGNDDLINFKDSDRESHIDYLE